MSQIILSCFISVKWVHGATGPVKLKILPIQGQSHEMQTLTSRVAEPPNFDGSGSGGGSDFDSGLKIGV